ELAWCYHQRLSTSRVDAIDSSRHRGPISIEECLRLIVAEQPVLTRARYDRVEAGRVCICARFYKHSLRGIPGRKRDHEPRLDCAERRGLGVTVGREITPIGSGRLLYVVGGCCRARAVPHGQTKRTWGGRRGPRASSRPQ